MTRSSPSLAVASTNSIAITVTIAAAMVGRTGVSDGKGRLICTTAPTTSPSSRYPGRAAQVGLITMPKPTVVTAYPMIVDRLPNLGRRFRAALTALIASVGLIAPRAGQAGDVVDPSGGVELQGRVRGPFDLVAVLADLDQQHGGQDDDAHGFGGVARRDLQPGLHDRGRLGDLHQRDADIAQHRRDLHRVVVIREFSGAG